MSVSSTKSVPDKNSRRSTAILRAGLLWAALAASARAQMNMDPYFTAINYPLEKHSLMLMVLPDFQVARYGSNFATGMLMAQYGITPQWTAGVMAEGQKIQGMPVTYGGMRYGTYFHLFRDDRFLNLTLYGEYEDLNEAALYKMEVAGFGPEDLTGPLAPARHAPVRTFEQRVIAYHDWDRVNATFNFIRETSLQSPRGSDYGYALGLFFKPSETTGTMAGMADMAAPPALSMSRFGCGLELIGALGDNRRFGFYWNAQQHYLGPVLTYALSPRWSAHLEPAFGLSDVSDPFVLRTGVTYMFGPRDPGAAGGGAVHAELRVDQRRVLRHHLRPGGRHAFQGFDSDRQRLPPPPRVFSRGHPGRPALGPRREEGLGTSAFAQRRLHGRARGG